MAVTSAYDAYGNLLTNPETGTTAGIVTLADDRIDGSVAVSLNHTTATHRRWAQRGP